MTKLCCIARHVLGKFYSEGESAKDYSIDAAKKYGVDVNELKREVFKQLKEK